VAARFGEEVLLFGGDGHADAAAETAASHAGGETGWVVLFGVAGELGHGEIEIEWGFLGWYWVGGFC
jgi:hypothetical protein